MSSKKPRLWPVSMSPSAGTKLWWPGPLIFWLTGQVPSIVPGLEPIRQPLALYQSRT
jgi:hypothetical protein